MHAWDLSKEVAITSTVVWSQVNNRERTQLHPSTENWIKDLLSMALPIRTRPSFPLSQSLLSGSFHKPLILLHQRADRMKTTINIKLTVTTHKRGQVRRHTSAAERSYPTSEVRGRSQEDPMPEGRRPRGATPCPRSGAAAERSNTTSKKPWLHRHRRA